MPIEKVGNKFRYGRTGKLYFDRRDAVKQAAAIKISQKLAQKKNKKKKPNTGAI